MINRVKITFLLLIFVLIGTLVLFFLKSIYTTGVEFAVAETGVFSINQSDVNSQKVFKLHGEVEFFYDSLLSPSDYANNNKLIPTGLIQIPGKWNDFEQNGESIAGHGKATYHFKINVQDKGAYGLKIKELKSAYALWVDGNYLGGAGKVGISKKDMTPSRLRKEYFFVTESKTIDVIIQCSNFHHRKGGLEKSIIFGNAQNLMEYKNLHIGVEAFIFGILFILFIYHLVLYTYRSSDKSILYFCLLCLAMWLRVGDTGEKVLLELAPYIPWFIYTRVEYISLLAIPIFTILFMRQLFPREISLLFVKLIVYPCILFIAVVLFTSTTVISYLPLVYINFLVVFSSYLLVVLFIAVIKRRQYSLSIFLGYFLFYVLSLNDAFFYANLVDTAFLMPLALLVLIFSQAYVLAQKNSIAYFKIEKLSGDLREQANQLEELVEIRTQTVQSQKEEIEQQKDKLQDKARELKTINERLVSLANFKRDMTNMMIHDLKTPLNNILGFLTLPGSIDRFKNLIHTSGWEMQNLIQNILDVEKNEASALSLNFENRNLYELVTKAYDLANFMIKNRNITFENKVPIHQNVIIDYELILRVFANLLSNATKYGNDNGEIEVSSNLEKIKDKTYCKVAVYNGGEPIPPEKIDTVFQKFTQLGNTVDDDISYSTGIGLTFCKLAVEAHGGKIGAISGREKGVTFWFTLPVE